MFSGLILQAGHHALSSPDKEGWLYKEDGVSKQTSLRWIVLKGSFLYFFKTQVGTKDLSRDPCFES